MRELIRSKTALRDLDSIYEYIAADSTVYAKRMVQRIMDRGKQATVYPESGRPWTVIGLFQHPATVVGG